MGGQDHSLDREFRLCHVEQTTVIACVEADVPFNEALQELMPAFLFPCSVDLALLF